MNEPKLKLKKIRQLGIMTQLNINELDSYMKALIKRYKDKQKHKGVIK